ncbi:MAG: hypothetical protein EBY30_06630 [Rhodospirillales bacterium]|nr:hypothetical protein [Rhodospirillales bacterium]
MPFFLHKDSGELHPRTMAILDQAADIVQQGGIEAWSRVTTEEILGAEDAPHYTKSSDILEVWFDSGSTFMHVLRGTHASNALGDVQSLGHHDTGPEADLYLEGHDQHRGWFHSSLLLSCAIHGQAPYRGLLTHGFTVDSQGRKMSKSLNNGIEPQVINQKLGAEIIRLWVAASDYSGDIAGDDKILARVVDGYRRIRNTLRFLLANVSDFDVAADSVGPDDLLEIDRFALARASALQDEILAHFEVYEFHPVVAKLQVYCSEDLGAFYLDVLKDRLYTTAPKSLARRSAQTALWHITQAMLRWMAPFMSFTAEEAWAIFAPGRGSIFMQTYWPLATPDAALLAKWAAVRAVRETVNKAIEDLRSAGGVGASLQAEVTLTVPPETHALLASLGGNGRGILAGIAAGTHHVAVALQTMHSVVPGSPFHASWSASEPALSGALIGIDCPPGLTHVLTGCEIAGEDVLLLIPATDAGMTLRRHERIDGRPTVDLLFGEAAPLPGALLGCGQHVGAAMAAAQRLGALLSCVEAVAGMGALLEQTIAYLNTRVQFEVALSGFQVLRHKVADLFAVQESARAMVLALLERVGAEGAVPERDVALAKLHIGPLSRRFAAATIQLHGGMGMTEELSASRLAKRLFMVEFEYGDAAFYEAWLLSNGAAQAAGLGNGDDRMELF